MQGPPLENATLVLRAGRIERIEVNSSTPAIDLGDRCILPRFVNAHTHLEFSSLQKPIPCKQPFADWIGEVVKWRRERQQELGADWMNACREAYLAGISECSSSGVGLAIDMATPPWQPEWLGASQDATSVGCHVWPTLELLGPTRPQAESAKEWAESRSKQSSMPTHWGWSPHAPYTTPLSLIQWSVGQSRIHNGLVSMHLAESLDEQEWVQTRSGPLQKVLDRFSQGGDLGDRPIPWIEYLQVLSSAKRCLIAHGNLLGSEEISFLAAHRDSMSVVYCPRTHAAFDWPSHPWQAMRRAGISVFLGTDSRASNPNLNILEEAAFLWHRTPGMRPETALEMISIEPASFLDASALAGSLFEGSLAPIMSVHCRATSVAQIAETLLNACT